MKPILAQLSAMHLGLIRSKFPGSSHNVGRCQHSGQQDAWSMRALPRSHEQVVALALPPLPALPAPDGRSNHAMRFGLEWLACDTSSKIAEPLVHDNALAASPQRLAAATSADSRAVGAATERRCSHVDSNSVWRCELGTSSASGEHASYFVALCVAAMQSQSFAQRLLAADSG